MKKKLKLVIILLAILIMILGREVYLKINNNVITARFTQEVSNDAKVSRATVVKMVSLLVQSREEITATQRNINFSDTEPDKWYDKYINSVNAKGIKMSATEEPAFRPTDYLTVQECNILLKNISTYLTLQPGTVLSAGVPENLDYYNKLCGKLTFPVQTLDQTSQLTMNQWNEIYQCMLTDGFQNSGITENALYLLKIDENANNWTVGTNLGNFFFDGYPLENYIDSSIKVYTKGNEIVSILEHEQVSSTIYNAWVEEGKDSSLKVFTGGMEKELTLENPLSENVTSVVGDIEMIGNKVKKISIKPEKINGKVLQTTDSYVEIENHGKIEFDSHYKVYRVYDGVKEEVNGGILVGYSNTDFIVADGKINAALIQSNANVETIRVAVKTNGFKDYFHNKVKITSDVPYTIFYGQNQKACTAGEVVSIKGDSEYLTNGRLRIESSDPNAKLTIKSIKRNGKNPSYRGKIEVSKDDKGLVIVNELSIEQYLYAVVPSEMPTSYHMEALKSQAVCARSYAYKQIVENSCRIYGAHVDDSVSYQVYNNSPENQMSIQAVNDTAGKVLEYNNDVATTYFFSTSCGYTSSADQVWFSTKKADYLQGTLQNVDGQAVNFDTNLSVEDNFRNFIQNDLCNTYDSCFPWYRWKVSVSAGNLRKTIDASIGNRYKVNPALIQVKNASGTYESKEIQTIGDVKNIKIIDRKNGGIVTGVEIEGTEQTIRVYSEYNIRQLLAPFYDEVIRKDGSKVRSLSLLPSAFFIIDKSNENDSYVFTGGGYGHGVGLSQNGAKAMADAGKNYEEILKHYYQGIEIKTLY